MAFGRSAGAGGSPPGGSPPAKTASTARALVADRDQLDYANLHLAAPDKPNRGRLTALPAARRYFDDGIGAAPDLLAAVLARPELLHPRSTVPRRGPAPPDHHWAAPADGYDAAYRATAPIDVPSDDDLHAVVVGRPEVKTTPRYITVPAQTQDVFRSLALRNPLDTPLLPGPVDIYVDGRFILATQMPTTAPGGRVELGLGVEQAIKVARNVSFDDDASGLLKRHRQLAHRVSVEIANHLPHPVTVEVRERVPVAPKDQDDIVVEQQRVEPPWDELRQHEPELRGGHKWALSVDSGATVTATAKWSIRIPSSHELVGGNRRDG